MAADDKSPRWIRISTSDWDSPVGRYVLAGGSSSDWAAYGRWCALRQLLASSPMGYVDVSDPRCLGSLARQLGLGQRACRTWLGVLADCGGIDREALEERGWVVDGDIYDQAQSYRSQCEQNRRNRARTRSAAGRDGSCDEPSTHG